MNQNRRTCLVYGDVFLGHDTGAFHPERPERLKSVMAGIEKSGIFEKLLFIRPEPAGIEWLEKVHDVRYIAEVRESFSSGLSCLHTPDNPVSRGTWDAAVNAAGGILKAVDAVMEGSAANAFCAVRPPGHHALCGRAMGFCFFNNAAIGARYAQGRYGLTKIAVIDWDAHHGNGTQEAFYRDPSVLYISAHQHPLFPGTGREDEKGEGAGLGYNLNLPLSPGSGDREYVHVFENKIIPAIDDFNPEFILLSAGFDAHADDPVGGMAVSTGGFSRLTELVKSASEKLCGGRLVSVLEGGYELEALSGSVSGHLEVLNG